VRGLRPEWRGDTFVHVGGVRQMGKGLLVMQVYTPVVDGMVMATRLMSGTVVAGDPVGSFLSTWATYTRSWMVFLIIIALVLGYVLYVIGHREGWSHMKGALAGAFFVYIAIAIIPSLFS